MCVEEKNKIIRRIRGLRSFFSSPCHHTRLLRAHDRSYRYSRVAFLARAGGTSAPRRPHT